MKLNLAKPITVYAVKCRDGQYRCVEAVSWKDCKRHCGSDAVSIRKRQLTIEDHRKLFMGGQEEKRDIYETGAIRPHNGALCDGDEPPQTLK